MGYPRILYQNRVAATGATLTCSAPATGYPASFLSNYRDYRRCIGDGTTNSYTFKLDAGAAVSAQALALAGHNLSTVGARYKLDASANDADWDAIVAYQTPTDDLAAAHYYTQASYRYWRLTVDNDGGANFAPELGVWFVGNYLEFEDYIDAPWDPDVQKIHGSRQTGETGRLLGEVVDFRSRPLQMEFPWVTDSWFTNTWLPFWEIQYKTPFFFDWNPGTSQPLLVRWDMDTMSAPYHVDAYRGPLKLSMFGVVD